MRRLAAIAALLAAPAAAPAAASAVDGLLILSLRACPFGWLALPAAQGRLLLLVNNSLAAGDAVGLPLSDGEDRAHSHGIGGSFSFDSKHIASLGGLNAAAARRGAQPALPFFNLSSPAGSGYPFANFELCRYVAALGAPPPTLPAGALALWDPSGGAGAGGCPAGSAPLPAAAAGRLLGVSGEAGWASSAAAPLLPGGDVAHTHAFTASVTLPALDFAGIDGCCDDDPTSAGTKSFSAVSGQGESALPHLSLLGCAVGGGGGGAAAAALPAGALLLTLARAPCPNGSAPLPAPLAGRLAVAAPAFGIPGRTFGAAAVPSLAALPAWAPNHTHAFAAAMTTVPAGVALDSGCCAHGYGRAGTFEVAAVIDAGVGDPAQQLPFALVQACLIS